MSRRDYYPVRRGSLQHETLRKLFVQDTATQEELRKAVDHGNVPSAPYFRQNVIDTLELRELIERVGRGEYSITRAGRSLVMELADAPRASVSPRISAPRVDFERPTLPAGIEFHMLISRLYYRDGRVTDMDGNRIEVGA